MQYEVKSVKQASVLQEKDGVYGVFVAITSGIIGQNYAGFTNVDDGFCPLLETDDSITARTKMDAYGAQVVAEKYPNT